MLCNRDLFGKEVDLSGNSTKFQADWCEKGSLLKKGFVVGAENLFHELNRETTFLTLIVKVLLTEYNESSRIVFSSVALECLQSAFGAPLRN